METRAKFVTIGAFLVATIVVAFLFVYWLGATSESTSRVDVRVVFPGPVTGLKIGGHVNFNGIRVGEVGEISFDPTDPKRVVAVAKVNPQTPLRVDTTAALGVSLLSGIAQIEFTGGSVDAEELLDGNESPILYAQSSSVEDLVRGSQQLVHKADKVLTDLSNLLEVNQDGVGKTVANVVEFTDALAANSEGVALFMSQLSDAAGSFTGLASRLSTLIIATEDLVKAVNPEGIENVINNVNELTIGFVDSTKLVNELITSANTTAKEIDRFAGHLNQAFQNLEEVIEDIDPQTVTRTLTSIDQITGTIASKSEEIVTVIDNTQHLTSSFSEIGQSLSGDMEQVSDLITDFRKTAAGLNATVDQLNQIVNSMNLQEINKIVNNTSELVSSASEVMSEVSSSKDAISSTLGNTLKASEDLGKFAKSLAEQNQSIGQIVADANRITTNLGDASIQVTSILGRIDELVEADGDGLIVAATKAVQSIANISTVLEQQAGPISENLLRFSDSGLKNLTTLLEDATRTINNLNRAITNFDRDPNRIIFGASDIPVYQGNP